MKIGVISDIHANIFALDNVLKEMSKYDVSKILVAGDLIGYYYWPKEVVSRLMTDEDVFCIAGNHEKLLKNSLNLLMPTELICYTNSQMLLIRMLRK